MPLDFSADGAAGAGQANSSTGAFSIPSDETVPPPITAPVNSGLGPLAVVGGKGSDNPNPRANLTAAQIAADPVLGTSTSWMGPAFAGANQNNTRMVGAQVMFEGGGTVGDDDMGGDPSGGGDSGLGDRMALALTSVDSALSYGRKLNGLPSDSGMDEGEKTAAAMPTIPGNQSETPGPYKPQPKVAAAMPMIPGNQSETPGPYKPQPKLADNQAGDGDQDETPTIPTDDEETA